MSEDPELITLLKKIRYDLTGLQAKVGEALRMAADLDYPEAQEFVCPHCGLDFRGKLKLAEHIYHVYGEPVPEHWEEAERRAEDRGREVEDS